MNTSPPPAETPIAAFFDFAARLLFFTLAPLGIVLAATLFPVYGALFSVFVALLVFVLGEWVESRASSSRILRTIVGRELKLLAYYRENPPRAFAYYVFYPILFPYWLTNAKARREFILFKGYTITGLIILLISTIAQYFSGFPPELGLREFMPIVGITVSAELMLVLALLMPIATTVISYHNERKRKRLGVLLAIALVTTGASLYRTLRRRDPVVSYATRERVRLRSAKDRKKSHDVLMLAVRDAMKALRADKTALDGDGKVEGVPLEVAHERLEGFYKHDEAFSFDLWASSRKTPELLVLYFEARRDRAPIWVALNKTGDEVKDPAKLPKGAFTAMKKATEN